MKSKIKDSNKSSANRMQSQARLSYAEMQPALCKSTQLVAILQQHVGKNINITNLLAGIAAYSFLKPSINVEMKFGNVLTLMQLLMSN